MTGPARPTAAAAWLSALTLIAVDLATKLWVEATMGPHDRIPVIPGLFSLVHIKNRGAAFGLGSDVEGIWMSAAFGAVAVVAVGVIILLYRSAPADDRVSRIAFVLVGAGAVGNLIDRLRQGEVTDFLLAYVGDYRWPAFNVADALITVGVLLLLVGVVIPRADRRSADS